MRDRVEAFLRAAADAGFNILITETWRSSERQEYLYSLGRTQPGSIVTWTHQSAHMLGEAIDIVFVQNGKATYQGDWEGVARVGEANGLSWGGRWPVADKPHFQFNPQWQTAHWAAGAEEKLLARGAVSFKKNLDEPVSRGEFYVIITKLFNL